MNIKVLNLYIKGERKGPLGGTCFFKDFARFCVEHSCILRPMAQFDPHRPDFAPYGMSVEWWTPTLMQRPDRHNEIEMNYLERGSITYLLGGRKVMVEAGRLTAFWAAIPHQIISMTDTGGYHVATIPLAWFLQWKLPTRLTEPILHGQMVAGRRERSNASDSRVFTQWRTDLARNTPEKRRVVLLEMQARLFRLALAMPTKAVAGGSSGPLVEYPALSKAEGMAGFLAKHYQEPIAAADIAQSVGLHPNYAMSLFKKVFATTLTHYLTQQRLSHAQRLLVTTNQKILQVALESGFGSVSRFNDAFHKAFGCTPRGYRQEHRG
jgi:AraC family transcriptional regulator, melibiose operon regulatory protein